MDTAAELQIVWVPEIRSFKARDVQNNGVSDWSKMWTLVSDRMWGRGNSSPGDVVGKSLEEYQSPMQMDWSSGKHSCFKNEMNYKAENQGGMC